MNDPEFETELKKHRFQPPPPELRAKTLAATRGPGILPVSLCLVKQAQSIAPTKHSRHFLPWIALAACWVAAIFFHAEAGTLAWQQPERPALDTTPRVNLRLEQEEIMKLLAEWTNESLPSPQPTPQPKQTPNSPPLGQAVARACSPLA